MVNQQIHKALKSNPKSLFLIDCLGAFLSSTLYLGVLAQLEDIFGMPKEIAYSLSLMAGMYAVYSGICYLMNLKKWQPYLKVIAFANLLHCCLTIALVIIYIQEITALGVCYFAGESVIVIGLSIIELRTASAK